MHERQPGTQRRQVRDSLSWKCLGGQDVESMVWIMEWKEES